MWDRLSKIFKFSITQWSCKKTKMFNLIIPVVDPHLQGLLKSVMTKPKTGDITMKLMRYESYLYDANTRISSLVCVETLLIDRSTLYPDFIGIILFSFSFTLHRILMIIFTFISQRPCLRFSSTGV